LMLVESVWVNPVEGRSVQFINYLTPLRDLDTRLEFWFAWYVLIGLG
jgi:hypothetical protein